MPLQLRLGGNWITPSALKIYAGGAWRSIQAVKIYADGAWRDCANFAPAGSGGGGGGTIALSISPSPVSRTVRTASTTLTTFNVTATPSGGIAPYTYSWVKQSGGSISAGFPTSATTAFSASGMAIDETRTAVFRCTCTDALGSTDFEDATVTLTRLEPISPSDHS